MQEEDEGRGACRENSKRQITQATSLVAVRNQLARYKTQTFTWTKFEDTRPTVALLPEEGLLLHMAVTRSRYEGSKISTPARSDPCT